ncbi:SdrD B-like domain-containing protein [Limnoraphis robusta Tam1]|uniref:SdrD B-like domain-containing protein n=1 Tax=Limnoraphis robusta CCNP1315 TaxID=3110306 RepID=A0ABU5TR51_9CYAN|nr:SdrD B-like domain-containing protein [Limnoraphis robusta]MEA5517337.1 SdrD B-like domain-containing protein [Limnoraphis robusta CCNP1315]MEA5542983.1 SdrD B-like domain-containing protein [Limnoraphis robusta Tam1]MEA5546074.1 SdrD B-like domain-containing protein [Limnoraphis robusta CCNP1324]
MSTIRGSVFQDSITANGIFDLGEGLPDVTVILVGPTEDLDGDGEPDDLDGDGEPDGERRTDLTNDNGNYEFTNLPAGEFTLDQETIDRFSEPVGVPLAITTTDDPNERIDVNILNFPIPNQPPIAVDDTATTNAGTPISIDVLANDSDPDNSPSPLSITEITTTPTNGTAIINDNGTLDDTTDDFIDYTPSSEFSGATFTYTITDGLATDTANVTITVNAVEPQPTIPTTLIVTTTEDENDPEPLTDPSDLSLREAIELANSNPDSNTIEFDPNVFATPQTINLSLGQLTITENLTINGLGADRITVDANQNSRVFNINDGNNDENKQVEINGLTITGGRTPFALELDENLATNSEPGGGIFSAENLTVINSRISENTASGAGGGIASNGFDNSTTIINSTISENIVLAVSSEVFSSGFGGGISASNLRVNNSTISGNRAEIGGGIETSGAVINNSTISGNRADSRGGGLAIFFQEVGFPDGTLVINNSTITQNSATSVGGISSQNINSRIPINNSIIAGNTGSASLTGGASVDLSDEVQGNDNLIGIPDGLSLDDILDVELRNNGGSTATHALVPGSPAIDAGNNDIANQNELITDQRGDGFDRIVDGSGNGEAVVDIGAFEVQEPQGLSTLTGAVFEDVNGNGEFDPGEGLEGVLVFIDTNENDLPEEGEPQTPTGADGSYTFFNLPVDTVTLNQVLPEGFVSEDTPAEIPLIANETVSFNILNVRQIPGLGSIQGVKFNDLFDQDGNFDPEDGETRIPDVPIFLELISENGREVIQETITDSDGSFLFNNLTPGTYVVREEPQLGFTRTTPPQEITVSADSVTEFDIGNQAEAVETGSITGVKFQDDSPTNGVQDPEELLLSGFTIYVDLDGDGQRDENEPSGITDENGSYSILDVPVGEWVLREDLTEEQQLEFLQSLDGVPVEVTASEQPTTANIGNVPRIPETGTIAGVKFEDLNQNGIQDPNEDPLPGFTIYIDSNNDGIFNDGEFSDSTNNQGEYRFDNLDPGTYIVREVQQPGFIQTSPNSEADLTVEVIANQESILNFGNFREASPETGQISGTKFNDANDNENLDPGEQGIGGVTIYLDLNNNGQLDLNSNDPINNEPFVSTGADGSYEFVDLTPGSYFVRELLPPGFARTTPDEEPITVSDGENVSFNIGNVELGSIRGTFFNDLNANGIRDLDEPGLPNFPVFLDLNRDNIPNPEEPTTISDVAGNYLFGNLFPDTYSVRQVNSGSFLPTLTPNPIVIESGSDAVNALNVNFGNGLPGILGFNEASYRINEDGTSEMEILVTRTEGSVGEVSATVETAPGTATSGLDYNPTPEPQTVTFANGDSEPKLVTIPIVDDPLIEPDETIILNLVNPTGGATLGRLPEETPSVPDIPSNSISGVVFNDLNANSLLDIDSVTEIPDEPLGDATVYLDLDNDSSRDDGEPTTTTDSNGNFIFLDLPPTPNIDPVTGFAPAEDAYVVRVEPTNQQPNLTTPVPAITLAAGEAAQVTAGLSSEFPFPPENQFAQPDGGVDENALIPIRGFAPSPSVDSDSFRQATLTINASDVGVPLDLSGIEDLEPVNSLDSFINAGVEISDNALGIVSFEQDGSGNFMDADPLNSNAITYDQGDSIILNVPAGFEQQFSFRYASPFFSGHTVTIYDQVNGGGTPLVAATQLPETNDSGDTPGAYEISAEPFSVGFDGIARSVVIGSQADKLVFTDLTFG